MGASVRLSQSGSTPNVESVYAYNSAWLMLKGWDILKAAYIVSLRQLHRIWLPTR
jgi:hypothetical protein